MLVAGFLQPFGVTVVDAQLAFAVLGAGSVSCAPRSKRSFWTRASKVMTSSRRLSASAMVEPMFALASSQAA